MSNSNGDDDRTVIRPRPGGSRQSGGGQQPGSGDTAQPQSPQPAGQQSAQPPPQMAEAGTLAYTGVNPLVGAAAPLLSLVGQLRNTATHPDVAGLRRHVIDEIKRFETNARAQSIPSKQVITARYILCAVIDETVLGTPWGSQSVWSNQSLLSTFHNDAWGGEKFFAVLERIMPDPATNRDLLELMYICMSLGFKGKYMIMDNGTERLEELRSRLFDRIRTQRGDFEQELAPHWQPAGNTGARLARYIPLWVVGAVAGAVLLAIYMGFSVMLESSSEPVYQELEQLERPARDA